jgi:hypothetical protein
MAAQVIHIHPQAPAKPDPGQACNGCGVCCSWQPCPMGVLVSGHRQGACKALRWDEGLHLYRCGMLEGPAAGWPAALRPLEAGWRALARRWIAAGQGCDCSLETSPAAEA